MVKGVCVVDQSEDFSICFHAHSSPFIRTISGYLHLLSTGERCRTVCLSALAAATPQPPPLPTSGIPLVPVKPVTEHQLVWRGRESSNWRMAHLRMAHPRPLSLASVMADTWESDTPSPL